MASKIHITLEVDDKGSAKIKGFAGNADKAFAKIKANASAGATQAGRMEKAWTGAINNMKNHWRAYSAAAGIAIAAVSAAVIGAGKKFKDAASALQEVQGKFDIVFAGQERIAEAWAKTLVDSYAMSRREAKQYLSSVQDLLVPMGMMPNEAARLSNEIVKLSADLGSFNNLPTAQVMENIQSALTGEYESMKKYGVVLNATTVQEKALTMGLAATKDELTAGMKAQAAYQLMVEGSTAAIGDMARTQDSAANQEKQTKALLEDISALLGGAIIPYYQAALKEINAWLKANKDVIAQNIPEYIGKIGDAIVFGIKVMKFFSNAWLGIKLVGTAAIQGIASVLDELFGALRFVLTPLDLIFKGLQKIGAIDVNPFDSLEKGLGQFRLSSADVEKSVLEDIQKTNKGYDSTIATIERWKDKLKETAVAQAKASKSIVKDVGKQVKTEQKLIKELTKVQVAAAQKAAKEKIKAAADYAKESTRIYERLVDDVNKNALSEYQYKDKLLDKQYAEYKKHLVSLGKENKHYADGVKLLDTWLKNEKVKIWEDEVRKHGSVADRMALSWKEYQREGIDANRIMYDAIDAGAAELERQLSANFFNILKGRMGEVKLDWEDMWDSMLRSASDYMARIATETAINTAAKAVSTGMDWLGTAMGWWAAGSWDIKKEQMAVLHPGEMIIPAETAERIRGVAAGRDQSSLGESWPTSTIQPGSFGETIEDAITDSLLSSLRGFAINKLTGLILTGEFGGINPLGLLGIFAKAVYSGIAATNMARDVLTAAYGETVAKSMDLDTTMVSSVYADVARNMGLPYGFPGFGLPRGYGYGPITPSTQTLYGGFGWSGFMDAYGISGFSPLSSLAPGFGSGGGLSMGSDSAYGGSYGAVSAAGEGAQGWRYGGISYGPISGHDETLHGIEAVVPLPDGRTIPVEMTGGADSAKLLAEIRKLRADLQAGTYAIARNTGKTAKILDKFDNDGLPAERT